MEILKIFIDRLVPPRRVCMIIIILVVVYLTPLFLMSWLNLLTKLEIAYQRWKLGYEVPYLLVP